MSQYIKTQQDAIDRLKTKRPTPLMSQDDINEAIAYHQANIDAEKSKVDFVDEMRRTVA